MTPRIRVEPPFLYFAASLSYCGPEWISDYTYEGMYQRRQYILSSKFSAREGDGAVKVFQVSGWLNKAGGYLNPLRQAFGIPVNDGGKGLYSLELADAQGKQLYRYRFDPQPIASEAGLESYGFALTLPDIKDTSSVGLCFGGILLDEVDR